MTLSINTNSPEVAHFLEENEIHNHINNTVVEVADEKQRRGIKVHPNLDLQFMLPNKREMLDYDRVTLQSFNNETTTLKIECLIPQNNLESLASADYYSNIVINAIDLESDFFSFQRIKFQREAYLNLIEVLNH